jgi:hypothetical protein
LGTCKDARAMLFAQVTAEHTLQELCEIQWQAISSVATATNPIPVLPFERLNLNVVRWFDITQVCRTEHSKFGLAMDHVDWPMLWVKRYCFGWNACHYTAIDVDRGKALDDTYSFLDTVRVHFIPTKALRDLANNDVVVTVTGAVCERYHLKGDVHVYKVFEELNTDDIVLLLEREASWDLAAVGRIQRGHR